MLGATLRVKSLVADLCRANSGVSTLVLDTNDLFIDEVLMRATGFIHHQVPLFNHTRFGNFADPSF